LQPTEARLTSDRTGAFCAEPLAPPAHPTTHESGMMGRAYGPYFIFVLTFSWGVAPG
jgi:hypothetical protein